MAFDGGDVLIITATRDEGSISRPGVSSSKTVSLNVSIESDDMDVIAEIIQEMGKFFKLTELNSEADFPEVFRDFADVCVDTTLSSFMLSNSYTASAPLQ